MSNTNVARVVWKSETRFSPSSMPSDMFLSTRRLRDPGSGEAVFAIRESAWLRLRDHTSSSRVEVGGILVGNTYVDPSTGRYLVDIVGTLPAIGAHGTSTYFKFTPASWDYISRTRDRDFSGYITVGWYHSHPGLGIFYSNTDRASQKAFFTHPWSIGIVIDPVNEDFGCFVGPKSTQIPNTSLVCYVPNKIVSSHPVVGTTHSRARALALTFVGGAAGLMAVWKIIRRS
jgi:proteasome lid subunit RPN8/RPN11